MRIFIYAKLHSLFAAEIAKCAGNAAQALTVAGMPRGLTLRVRPAANHESARSQRKSVRMALKIDNGICSGEDRMADGYGRRLLVKAREPGRMSDTYSDPQAPEIFADGVGAAVFGPAVSRLAFFKTYDFLPSDTLGINEMIEMRQINLNLVMPTTALIEFAANLMASAATSREALSTTNAATLDTIERALATIREAKPKGQ